MASVMIVCDASRRVALSRPLPRHPYGEIVVALVLLIGGGLLAGRGGGDKLYTQIPRALDGTIDPAAALMLALFGMMVAAFPFWIAMNRRRP